MYKGPAAGAHLVRSRSRKEAFREERKVGICSYRQQQHRTGCATGPRIVAEKGPGFSSNGRSGEEIVETVQRHPRVKRGCRKWMDLKTVILSEVSQTKKQK